MKQMSFYLTVCLAIISLMTSCSKDDDSKPAAITIEMKETTEHSSVVTFNKIEGAFSYDVEYAVKGEELEYEMSIDATKELTYNLKELKSGCDYTVKVIAEDVKGSIIGEGTLDFKTKDAMAALIGEWKYTHSTEASVTYKFNEDGFGTYTYNSEKQIMWSATADKLTITKYADKVGGSSTTETYDFEVTAGVGVVIDKTIYSIVK